MDDIDDLFDGMLKAKRGIFFEYNRLLERLELGLGPEKPKECPKDCMMRDQILIGRGDFMKFLHIDKPETLSKLKKIGLPYAKFGIRWWGTTFSVMRWLTNLVEARAEIFLDYADGPPEPEEKKNEENLRNDEECAIYYEEDDIFE